MGTGLHFTAVVVQVVVFLIDWGITLNRFIFSTTKNSKDPKDPKDPKDKGIQNCPSMQSYQNLESAKFRLSQDLNRVGRILP